MTDIREMDRLVMDSILDDTDATKEQITEELNSAQDYEDRLAQMKFKVSDLTKSRPSSPTGSATDYSTAIGGSVGARRYKLPKIELTKFNGDMKDFLTFWSQFSKIHEDDELSKADKFHYLHQSMVSGSRAYEVLSSFPQTPENYEKAVASLKSRFGKDDQLVEFYVRELLRLVIHNSKDRVQLAKLFDKLECQLNALESLGMTTEKHAAMLFPLVESSLPEEVLRAWQRSIVSNQTRTNDSSTKSRLELLMDFLRCEVESEERISLAKAGFRLSSQGHQKYKKEESREESTPTAAGLFSGDVKVKCVFCDKQHESKECFKAHNMSMVDKKKILQSKRCCFVCFKANHMSKNCKASVKCLVCGKRHHILMCPSLPKNETKPAGNNRRSSESECQLVSNNSSTGKKCLKTVLLQTLVVRLIGNGKEKVIRILFDVGAQRSYIRRSTAAAVVIEPYKVERFAHSLFGGVETGIESHQLHRVQLQSLDRRFSYTLQALDKGSICGQIPRLPKGPWLKELSKKGIFINDCGTDCPDIEILIGADYYGKLLTGKIVQLDSGLTAQETRLGWTVIGRLESQVETSVSMMVTTMLVSDYNVTELWKLDAIGIMDSEEQKSREDLEAAAKEHFLQNVKLNQENRYEVDLPWVQSRQKIPDNRELAQRRLLNTTKKLKTLGYIKEYDNVFKEWLKEGVIEEVPKEELDMDSHYLPHRPVIKANSSTKVWPVFDASAKCGRSPSLNECLEKGHNLLELIPSTILRFREGKFGVTSDIRKAFLQVSVRREDRDYLRFLWWSDVPDQLKVFRHRRVVFV